MSNPNNHLTIIDTISKPYGISVRKFYVCKCICGVEITRTKSYMDKNLQTTRTMSCGCKNPNKQLGSNSKTWRGYGQVSAEYLAGLRIRAKRKNIDFNITPKYMWELFLKQNQQCILSGQSIALAESKRTNQIMTASIDRIDPTKGYVEDNVQWVHTIVNYMKHTSTNLDFINWCHKISTHNT